MYILTIEVNDYNQHGSYFVAAYLSKPTLAQLSFRVPEDLAKHILNGGGRQKLEEEWYTLTEVEDGEWWAHD